MFTDELLQNLKVEMKQIVENISKNNFQDSKNNIECYFDLLSKLVEFESFRNNLLEKEIITVNYKISEQEDILPATTSILEKQEDIQTEPIQEGRKMYRFERRIKAGCLPEINAYVPESIIRKLNLENNCYLYAEEIGDEYNRHFNYVLAKESDDPSCPGRVQINFCLVEKQDNFLVVRKSFETGSDIRINDTPYSILIRDTDITEFRLKEEDLVDIAFPVGRPEEAKVLWVHKDKFIQSEETYSDYSKTPKNKSKNIKPGVNKNHQTEVITTLKNKKVLIIGNEPDKTTYKEALEERGGTFLWADAKDSVIRLEAQVRKSDLVIFLLKVSGHVGMEKVKAFCKEYDVPFLTTFSLGKSSIIRIAEDCELEQEIS